MQHLTTISPIDRELIAGVFRTNRRDSEIIYAIEIDPASRSANQTIVDREFILAFEETRFVYSTYLRMLESITKRIIFIALKKVDIEVTVPDPGPECPVCLNHYCFSVRMLYGHTLGRSCLHNGFARSIDLLSCPLCRARPIFESHFLPEGKTVDVVKVILYTVEMFLSTDPCEEMMAAVKEWVNCSQLIIDVPSESGRHLIELATDVWECAEEADLWRWLSARWRGEQVVLEPNSNASE